MHSTSYAPASQTVQGPAIGLIVTACIGLLLIVLNLLVQTFGFGMAFIDSLYEQAGLEDLPNVLTTTASGGLAIVMNLFKLALAALVLYGGFQMMRLRSWPLCILASVVAMVPCIGPCCLIGLPIGIWSLVILSKPEVKSAFTN